MSFDLDDDETLISISRTDRYEGEDTSPTTDRELKAWYAYPIAAEVFAVVAVVRHNPLLHQTRTHLLS
jgi:UMF1 family MFS transporter